MGCIDDQELQAVQNIVHLQRWYFDFNIFCFLYCLEKNGRKEGWALFWRIMGFLEGL